MSTKKISKSVQQCLKFDNETVECNFDSEIDFVLKINEGHLKDLKISTISNLLSALGQIVGVDQATFKTIKEGSTTIAISVPNEMRQIVLSNISRETKSKNQQVAKIQKELKNYGYSSAEFSVGRIEENKPYIPDEIIFRVFKEEVEEEFSQQEKIDGRLTRLQKGRDKSDHITIILSNGNEVPAECSKGLLKELHPYFDKDTFLRFEGSATYSIRENSLDLRLKKYKINNFIVIEDIGFQDWIDKFKAQGESDWLKCDDPIAEWLKERKN